MGVPDEHQTLLPLASMRHNPRHPMPTRWQRMQEYVKSPGPRKSFKALLGLLVILCVAVALLGDFDFRLGLYWHMTGSYTVRQRPVMTGTDDLEWQPIYGCRNTPNVFPKITAPVKLGADRHLAVRQKVETHGRQPRVFGQIVLRPAGDNKTQGTIDLEVISNDKDLRVHVDQDLDGNTQIFKMTTPRLHEPWWSSAEGPCIHMRATVWIPRHACLGFLSIGSVHLDDSLVDGLVMDLSDGLRIDTVVGDFQTSQPRDVNDDVAPYALNSRNISIETVSGEISAWLPLYDWLTLSSVSGNIIGQVVPKPVDDKSPRPALLTVSSVSGRVKVTEPLAHSRRAGKPDDKLPAREYVASLATVSGDIDAQVALSSSGRFHSISGNMKLELLPVLDVRARRQGPESELQTKTESGSTRLTVWEPARIDVDSAKPALNHLRSQHHSLNGDLRLSYPSSWQGQFHAHTMTGDIEARGKDLEITRRSRGLFETTVDGRKGHGQSVMKLDTLAGDIHLTVGK